MLRRTDKQICMHSGYTLVELSIVLIILSLLMASGLALGASMVERAAYVDTATQLKQLEQSLRDYYIVNNRLPCVAPIDTAISDADFGVEVADCPTAGTISGTLSNNGTWVGMIPVRTLGLPDKAASDKFGSRIVYAVTEDMTNAAAFGGATGTISIFGMGDVTPIQTEMAYALYSHGRDRKGAFTYNTGTVATPCGSSDNRDVMNCTFTDASQYRDVPFNSGDQEDFFFDDVIRWAPKYHFMALDTNSGSLWTKRPDNDNIYSVGADSDHTNTFVGIGIDNPQKQLDVKGDVHVDGFVGIGLANPLIPLHVEGTEIHGINYTRTDARDARISVADSTQQWSLASGWATAGDFSIVQEADGSGPNAGDRFYIKNSNGFVGINTSDPQSTFDVRGGPIYVGEMWLGVSGATNTAPDIHMDTDGLIAVDNSLRFAIDGANDGGNNIHFYKGGLNTVDATEFARLTNTSSLYLGLDGSGSFISGSSALNQRLMVDAAQSYDDGGAVWLHGRTHPDYPGSIRHYAAKPSSSDDAHKFLRRWGGSTTSLLAIRADGDVWRAGAFIGPSDARLKKDIEPITNALEKLSSIEGVYYRWNGKGHHTDTESQHIGVIAQEVQAVFPAAVKEGESGFLALEETALIPPLIEAVKELDSKNAALESRVSKLEMRLANAEGTAETPSGHKDYSRIIIFLLLGVIIVLLLRNGRKRA